MSDKCKSTTVEAKRDIIINDVKHAGSVSHACVLPQNHTDAWCICACGKQWQKFNNV